MSPGGRAHLPARERIAQAFTQVEDVLYVGIGVVLAAGAVGLLINAAVTFGRRIGAGAIGGSIVGMLDQLLLILMMIEILYTVQVSFREHVLVPEPFVLVAMIAGCGGSWCSLRSLFYRHRNPISHDRFKRSMTIAGRFSDMVFESELARTPSVSPAEARIAPVSGAVRTLPLLHVRPGASRA